jgi:two-component system, NarL family, invasion response regulator UvrY
MSGVGVLTVHDDEGRRRAARAVVNATPGFQSVGEAASAEEALELAAALRPALVLVGTGMPGIDGFETSERLVAARPETAVVLIHDGPEPGAGAVAGARAAHAVPMQSLTPEFLRALWEAHEPG